MGYVCRSHFPPEELVHLIRKTLTPGEYILGINRASEMILRGLDTRNSIYNIWEWDFYEGERYIELCAVYNADAMLRGETAYNLIKEVINE